jgi:hypothetical protein
MKTKILGRTNHLLLFDVTWNTENYASSSSVVAYVFVAALMFLLSHCLAMIMGYTYRHTD